MNILIILDSLSIMTSDSWIPNFTFWPWCWTPDSDAEVAVLTTTGFLGSRNTTKKQILRW